VELLQGPPDPGIGFAIGMERVALVLGPVPDRAAAWVLLIPLGEPALARCLALAQELRGRDVPAEVAYGGRRLRQQLDRANRRRIPYAVILGDRELERREVILRDMTAGAQELLAIPDALERLRASRAGSRT
jgi:histidyl-tRNA synthetase